jgi:hypothetical protein
MRDTIPADPPTSIQTPARRHINHDRFISYGLIRQRLPKRSPLSHPLKAFRHNPPHKARKPGGNHPPLMIKIQHDAFETAI